MANSSIGTSPTTARLAYAVKKAIKFPVIEEHEIAKLKVDEDYQRMMHEGFTDEMANEFDEDLFDPVLVAVRPNGDMMIVDGLQHTRAAEKCNYTHVPCRMIKSRGKRHEAELFYKRNTTVKKMRDLQKYHSALVAGDKEAKLIQAITTKYGYTIAGAKEFSYGIRKDVKTIFAIRLIMDIHRKNVVPLRTCMRLLRVWFGDKLLANTRDFIGGLYLFLAETLPDIKAEKLMGNVFRDVQAEAVLTEATELQNAAGRRSGYKRTEYVRQVLRSKVSHLLPTCPATTTVCVTVQK